MSPSQNLSSLFHYLDKKQNLQDRLLSNKPLFIILLLCFLMCFKYQKSNINTLEFNATYCIIIIKMISCVWQTLDYLDIPPSNHPHSRVFCLPRFLIRFPTALINHSKIFFSYSKIIIFSNISAAYQGVKS